MAPFITRDAQRTTEIERYVFPESMLESVVVANRSVASAVGEGAP